MALEDLVYVYGVCRCPSTALTLPLGLQRETQLVTRDEIATVVEYGIDLEALQAEDQRLLTAVLSHDRVVCELFQQVTILPIRFGTQLASTEKLREYMGNEYQTYLRKLTELEQKCEYQIKLLPEPITLPPPPEGLKGRDYFVVKKQRLQDQTAAQAQQQIELRGLFERIHATFPNAVEATNDDGTAKVYVLLDNGEAPILQQQAEQWQSEAAYWHLSLSEALPPYHFV
jgi:hypothetical protein